MNRKLLALFGLKWNPFSPEIPIESLYNTNSIDHFCWRIENVLIREGGYALGGVVLGRDRVRTNAKPSRRQRVDRLLNGQSDYVPDPLVVIAMRHTDLHRSG